MAYTIEQYLSGKVDFNISENTLNAIFADRGVTKGTPLSDVTEKQKDLCLADLYMYMATSSTSKTGEYESDGGWQRQRSAKNVVDRAGFREMARELYDKWDEKPVGASTGKIKMKPIY